MSNQQLNSVPAQSVCSSAVTAQYNTLICLIRWLFLTQFSLELLQHTETCTLRSYFAPRSGNASYSIDILSTHFGSCLFSLLGCFRLRPYFLDLLRLLLCGWLLSSPCTVVCWLVTGNPVAQHLSDSPCPC